MIRITSEMGGTIIFYGL